MNLFIAGTDFVCILFLSIIALGIILSGKEKVKSHQLFLYSVLLLALFAITDCVSFIMDEVGGFNAISFTANLFSFLGVDIVMPFFFYYITKRFQEKGTFSNVHARVIAIACSLDIALVIYGTITGQLFVTQNGHTVYGPFSSFSGVLQLAASIYFLAVITINRKVLDKRVVFSTWLYFIMPLLAMFAGFIAPSFTVAYMATSISFLIVYIVIVREDLKISALKEKRLFENSITDSLTGINNGRAYRDDAATFTTEYPSNFVYLSLDLNGLKEVNDNLGHAAGDEIIVGAANCMRKCFEAYGKIYRNGGDEFIAILYADDAKLENILNEFNEEIERWKGTLVDSLSVSFGYAKANEIQGKSIHDVSIIADERMYVSKTAYYSKKGVDRRGQAEAHVALCNLYTKILKINITDDTFQVVNMDLGEQTKEKGFGYKISKWLYDFGKLGNIHPDDLENYLAKTDISFLRDYFRKGKKSFSVFYRRRFGDDYKNVVMEIIPANDYSEENQSLFLYVKDID